MQSSHANPSFLQFGKSQTALYFGEKIAYLKLKKTQKHTISVLLRFPQTLGVSHNDVTEKVGEDLLHDLLTQSQMESLGHQTPTIRGRTLSTFFKEYILQ